MLMGYLEIRADKCNRNEDKKTQLENPREFVFLQDFPKKYPKYRTLVHLGRWPTLPVTSWTKIGTIYAVNAL